MRTTVLAIGTFLAALCLRPVLDAQSPGAFEAVRPKMQEFADKGEIAGVVTLVATRNKVLHLAAAGKSDLASGRAMKTDDIFWIASMSKPVTAVAVAMLADEGKLSFDDALEKHLPEFRAVTVADGGVQVPPTRAFTVRDVLTHTSGLGELSKRDPHLTLEATSRQVAALPLRFQPGSRWAYSTAGFDVLGRLVEVVAGVPFDRFLQTRLFAPLGMTDTSFRVGAERKDRWARSYQWVVPENTLRETTITYMYGTDVSDVQRPPLGGAGLFSTAADVARFYQMMLNQGELNGRRILKAATVAEMVRKQTGTLTARPGMPWGLGFSVVENPEAMEANKALSPSSFGHGGAYSTQSWADPGKGLIWVVMFQRNGRGNPDNSDVRIAFQNTVIGSDR